MLRRLVIMLMVVMIAGFVILIYALVTRLSTPAPVALPDQIALPAGAAATAFTQGANWYAVVTADNRILIFDRTTGALRQTIEVK